MNAGFGGSGGGGVPSGRSPMMLAVVGAAFSSWENADERQVSAASRARGIGFMRKVWIEEVLPGGRGVRKSLTDDRDGLWPISPKAGGLDIHHHLPGLWVGLAASLRSMPTAAG